MVAVMELACCSGTDEIRTLIVQWSMAHAAVSRATLVRSGISSEVNMHCLPKWIAHAVISDLTPATCGFNGDVSILRLQWRSRYATSQQ